MLTDAQSCPLVLETPDSIPFLLLGLKVLPTPPPGLQQLHLQDFPVECRWKQTQGPLEGVGTALQVEQVGPTQDQY